MKPCVDFGTPLDMDETFYALMVAIPPNTIRGGRTMYLHWHVITVFSFENAEFGGYPKSRRKIRLR
jgi:hypothetical protein